MGIFGRMAEHLKQRLSPATIASEVGQSAAAVAGAVKSPTFLGRVCSFVVGHLVFSLITGAIGFWGIVKGFGMILAIPSAILLYLLGGKGELPGFIQNDAKGVMRRAGEALGDKKEELYDRLRREKEELGERLHGRIPENRDEAGQRLQDGRDAIREGIDDASGAMRQRMGQGRAQLSAEISRQKRQAAWNYVTSGSVFGR